MGCGECVYDIYLWLLWECIVCVMGLIDDSVVSFVIVQFFFLQFESNKKFIYMYINSFGGVVIVGLVIYDIMQYIFNFICIWCVGQVVSMGFLFFVVGSLGMCYLFFNFCIMIYQFLGGVWG